MRSRTTRAERFNTVPPSSWRPGRVPLGWRLSKRRTRRWNCYDESAVTSARMIRFEDILDKVEAYKPDFDEELLQKAYIFSAREHRGQVRDSREPYLVHPLYVAYILAD